MVLKALEKSKKRILTVPLPLSRWEWARWSSRVPVLGEQYHGSIVYTRDQQMALRRSGGMGEKHEIPKKLRKKYRGCRAGKTTDWLPTVSPLHCDGE
ncbi:hypothetical protein L3Q82_003707 [Scortum barcoo]|uniref:Uncharacterized protein n=1 Tax=Scortum barcoo TaxID=214431 RepID=A0ACB8X671_9TELE|nr:hypothetical protein L3Q82_003707 [Scortum barcoo]